MIHWGTSPTSIIICLQTREVDINHNAPCDHTYMVCPKSNASDFFAQPRMARKGKWESRQVEGEPTYTVGRSLVESAPF